MIRTIATATWTPKPGDPSAVELGRWCVEVPDIGHIATIERGPWEHKAVAEDLRQLLEIDGVSVGEVEIGLDVVTAIAPLDNTIATPATHPQQSLIDGLRQFANVLEAHPGLAVIKLPSFHNSITRRDGFGNPNDDAGSIADISEYSTAIDIPMTSSPGRNGRIHHVIDGAIAGLAVRIYHISDPKCDCHHTCTDGGEL